MVTIKLLHPNGQKETAHFQDIVKCGLWMNLHYKKVTGIVLLDSKTNEKFEFKTKHDFEDFCKQRAKK